MALSMFPISLIILLNGVNYNPVLSFNTNINSNQIRRRSATTATFRTKHLYSTATASSTASSSLPSGVNKIVKKPGSGPTLNIGDVATVKYSCFVKGSSSPFARSLEQKVVVGDGLMIDAWELSLATMSLGEIATIDISDPKYGYGSAGVVPFVPPDAPLTINLEILEAETGVDLGTIASADPLKPRTPQTIAAAYASRRELASIQEANKVDEEEGGLKELIKKFKSFYFFGFFEGETGQQAPWYLRPSITFPIAFAIVGAAFYVLFIAGGITERGTQVMDELDDYIIEQSLYLF